MYPLPEPQGHGTAAAPPNPEVEPLFFFLDFCLVDFLALSCKSDGCLRDDNVTIDICRVFKVNDDTHRAASAMKRMISLLLIVMVCK